MSRRQRSYYDLLAMCRNQTTGWLQRCYAEPGKWQNAISLLAVRNALRERSVPFVDVCQETAYGSTRRLSFQIRVF